MLYVCVLADTQLEVLHEMNEIGGDISWGSTWHLH